METKRMLRIIARFKDTGRELGQLRFDFIEQDDPVFLAIIKDFEDHGYKVEVIEEEDRGTIQ